MPQVNGIEIAEQNRFSEYVLPDDKAGLAILDTWLNWFESHDIQATLALTGSGFAVFRTGLLSTD